MNKENKLELLRLLESMISDAEGDQSDIYSRWGICNNLHIRSSLSYCPKPLINDILKEAFSSWAHFSGNPDYPVGGPEGLSGPKYYQENDLWSGRQLVMRIDLLFHIIRVLKSKEVT